MRRLSLWMRAHPMAGDSLIAILLMAFDALLFVVASSEPASTMKSWYIALPLDAASAFPVVFRRKYPLPTAYVLLLTGIPHSALELGASSGVAAGIALYTLLVYVGRRQALIYLLAQVLVSVVQLAVITPDPLWPLVLLSVLALAFCWVLGEFVGARQAYHAEMEARLHLLETERDHAARLAVGEERGRIARELHDVVAHAVSVIVVQADGASYAIRSNPAVAERAVQTISQTGREALAELRRLLEVLRNENGDGEPRIPQPGADALAELADRVRAAGVPVQLDLGTLKGLPAGVSLGVYRIVQESLTNTLKHAGRGARAEVRVRRSDEVVDVEILDDGAGKAQLLVPFVNAMPGGNGVIGMRERAHVFGGELEVGPREGGGWRVHATLPVRLAP